MHLGVCVCVCMCVNVGVCARVFVYNVDLDCGIPLAHLPGKTLTVYFPARSW